MEKLEVVTNAILIKSRKRFDNSRFAKSHKIDENFLDTKYKFKGLYRTNQHWVLESKGEYFIMPLLIKIIL